MKPTERFSGLADLYAVSRPSYPREAIDFIMSHCRLSNESMMVDVGCGTGISTRLFAERGVAVKGVEPNDEMRLTAETFARSCASSSSAAKLIEYCKGTAEDTGLLDGCADAVLSAQAFHWFDPELAFKEFHRILKAEGHIVLMWNERDETNDFTLGYGDLFRQLPETAKVEMKRGAAGDPIFHTPLFKSPSKKMFSNQQELDLEGVLGRAFSASYAPKDSERAAVLRDGLTSLFQRFQVDGKVVLKYETSVFVAQRA